MRYIKAIYIGLIGMMLAGCQADQWEGIEGGFQITLSDEATVTTKSTPAELGEPTTDKFKLKIVNEATNNAAYDGAYKSGTIPAAAGTYTVTATFGDNPVLALDDPYYKGDTTGVKVEEGQTTSITLNCKVANALATIFYADTAKFDEMYSSYGVEVKVNNYSVTIGDGTKESAYYQAGSKPTFTFKGVLKGNNKEISKILEDDLLSSASTFEARKHCKLTLSMEATASGLVPTISKAEATTVTINETIPMEWLPAPKVSSTGFDENKTLTIYETVAPDAASIDFEVAQPLQDLSFTLNFEDEQFTSLNKDYQLSTMTDEEKIALSDAGITLPLIGSNEPKITFSQAFNARLLSKNEDDGVVENTITINSVQANNRENKDEAPLTYIIAVHKPEFSVSVLPGNIWTKEFTAEEITVEEGEGDLGIIKKDLVYQYQDSDGIWRDFSNQDAHQQVFEEHPQNRNYKIRALYRNVLASNEVEVELEEPKALPNGNMDAWTETTREAKVSGIEKYQKPFFQPWDNVVTQWWDMNSIVTMPSSITSCFWDNNLANFKSFPTTTFKTPGYEETGKAAVIRTINVNNANTSGTHFGDNVRGILYAGTTSSDGNLSEGRLWNSRPTQLSFKYQYSSYDNERFGVYIELYADGNSSPIATGSYESVNGESKTNFTQQNINLEYSNLELKPSTIKIKFCSVAINDNPSIKQDVQVNVPEGSSNYYNVHGGSVLTIDDISLVYDK